MNLVKLTGFFDPTKVDQAIHIIGCGAVGSYIGVQLAKCGITNIHLWDDDVVEEKNIVNQAFDIRHVRMDKVSALKHILLDINPGIKVTQHKERYTDQMLSGYVFLAVDSIDTRREIVELNQYNVGIKAFFDTRIGIDVVQHFAAERNNHGQMKRFINSMQFTHDEVVQQDQDGACTIEQSIVNAVLVATALTVTNFINHLNGNKLRDFAHQDIFNFQLGSH